MKLDLSKNIQDKYSTWKNETSMPNDLKKELEKMQNNPKDIKNAFNSNLSFGTAGMRGKLGVGTNQLNIYTIRQATEGLAKLMDKLNSNVKKRGVIISYDSRYNSKIFAHEAARVLGVHNIKTFVFDDIRPTPELSFAVRQLKAYAGIMITASHNPKQYNGFKLYGEDGGQMPPKESNLITSYIREVKDIFNIPIKDEKELRKNNMMNIIGEDIDEKYLSKIKTVSLNPSLIKEVGSQLKFVYTPLHGTGKIIGRRALEEVGFKNYEIVPEQTISDPEFPTVPFPNPEFPQTFDLATKLGNKVNADVLIATDPDADRLGAAVKQPDNSYKLITGNQIAILLLNYILLTRKENKTLPKNGVIVKSIVSTELATTIAKDYGIKVKNVLTGFKFIAEKIKEYEKTPNKTFLFGFEESFGYLIKPFVRDKDAIQSATLLAEVAAYYKKQGLTLYDGLQKIYKKYGYFKEKTLSKELEGLEGKSTIEKIMKYFRKNSSKSLFDTPIEKIEDFQSSITTTEDGNKEKIKLPKSNVLKYWLKDGTWIAIRPSGTEPKIKFYIGVKGINKSQVNQKVKKYEKTIDNNLKKV